jgi:hypothetical protein
MARLQIRRTMPVQSAVLIGLSRWLNASAGALIMKDTAKNAPNAVEMYGRPRKSLGRGICSGSAGSMVGGHAPDRQRLDTNTCNSNAKKKARYIVAQIFVQKMPWKANSFTI